MNSGSLIEKERAKREAHKEKIRQERLSEDREKGISSKLVIRDGGNVLDEITQTPIYKRIILLFKNDSFDFEYDILVSYNTKEIDEAEFSTLHKYYFKFLTDSAYYQLIDHLNIEVPKMFK